MPTTRPTRWLTRRRIIWSILAIAALWLTWQVYDIITGRPRPTIDYATPFYELCNESQPEGENAWPLLMQVLDRVEEAETALEHDPMAVHHTSDGVELPGQFDDLGRYKHRDVPSMQPHHRWLRTLDEEGTFDRLRELAAMRRCVRPRMNGNPFNEAYVAPTSDYTARVRDLARLETGRLALAADSWDWEAVAELTDESLALFQFVGCQPSLIEYLVMETCTDLLLGEVRYTLIERPLPEPAARRLLRVIDQRDNWPTPEYIMAGEHLLRLDNIQNEYTASGRMPVSTLGRFSKPAAMPGAPPSKRSLHASIREVAAIVIPGRETAERLDAQYVEDVVRIANATDASERQSIDDGWLGSAPLNQIIIETTTIRPSLFANSWPRLRQSIESTRVTLGIEIYIDQVGHAPNSLDDLVPDVLPALPVDPLNGQPWGYCRISTGSAGSMYLLWSFGEDGQDNHCEEDEGSFGLHAKPGTDIWINKPRPVR